MHILLYITDRQFFLLVSQKWQTYYLVFKRNSCELIQEDLISMKSMFFLKIYRYIIWAIAGKYHLYAQLMWADVGAAHQKGNSVTENKENTKMVIFSYKIWMS